MKSKLIELILKYFQNIYPYYSSKITLNISRDEFENYLVMETELGFGTFYDHSNVINYNYPKDEKK